MAYELPLMLSSGFTTLTSGQITRLPDEQAIKNPYEDGFLLDEIRFTLAPSSGTAAVYRNIAVKFVLNDRELQNDWIPVQMLCPDRDSLNFVKGGSNAYGSGGMLTWKLPKPLYIPPGGVLTPQFWAAVSNVNLWMAYVGRRCPVRPKLTHVPWIGVYKSAPSPAGTPTPASITEQTMQYQFANPFDVPLYVERFSGGRYHTMEVYSDQIALVTQSNTLDDVLQNTTVRMISSMSRGTVRDETPLNHLFHWGTQSWPVRCKLPPKHYFDMFLTKDAATSVIHVVMAGYREVPL